jgi:hypothetical protein
MYVVTSVSDNFHSVLHVGMIDICYPGKSTTVYQSTRNRNIEDQNIHLHRHGNLESHTQSYIFFSEIFIIFVSSKIDVYSIILRHINY